MLQGIRLRRYVGTVFFALQLSTVVAMGDIVLFGYEGNTLLGDPGSGFEAFNPCEPGCSARIENGHHILEWSPMGDFVGYTRTVSGIGDPVLPSLWAEWGFRSNQPKPITSTSCDGRMSIDYLDIGEITFMFQDAVVDFEGGDFVFGLDTDIFHTYRFESEDGANYTVSVDGIVFNVDVDADGSGFAFVQPGGRGACGGSRPQPVRNEWDFIRYGTIGTDEQVVSVDPLQGNLTAAQGAQFRSFVITFDQPAYLYVDDLSVSVTGGVAPSITATRRPDNAPPEVLEVFVDGTPPPGETTTFSFDTGTGPQTIAYFRIQPEVPASSTWGLVLLTLVALIVGAATFRPRHRAPV